MGSLRLIKIANLMMLSMVMVLFLSSLLLSPQVEATNSAVCGVGEASVRHPECYKYSLHFMNREKCSRLSVVHVAIPLDDEFLRGTIAAVHSILLHSMCPENVFFHFIVSDSEYNLQEIVSHVFPSLKFKAHYFDPDIVKNLISDTSERLQEPLNYARNYLPDLLGPRVERVIYLDSDVLVVDDISIIWRTNLGSRIVGSSEYCTVNLTEFFTSAFWSEKKISDVFTARNPCYFNTGVMVIDLVKWRRFGYTRRMERWMQLQKQLSIYRLGSMPPFLLEFAGEVAPIDRRWNQHGIGEVCRKPHPFPISLLHWSGKGKPWLRLALGQACPIDFFWSHYDLCKV